MFDYLANATGVWVFVILMLFTVLVLQWVFWIFGWGRFSQRAPVSQGVRFIIADLAANIINDFRHLLALLIILIYGGVMAFGLVRAGADVESVGNVLQAVSSSLGGLIGAMIGYYFGESAGRRRTFSESRAIGDVEQSDRGSVEPVELPELGSNG